MLNRITAQKIVNLMAKSISLRHNDRYEEALAFLDEGMPIWPLT